MNINASNKNTSTQTKKHVILDKVSIIVPIYKVEKELDRCVRSLLGQTYKNIEIILINDGSPDFCPQLCEKYARKDRRIKVVHKENGGLSSARNRGLEVAEGQYISFVDGDDWVEPDFIEALINNLKREKADISIIGYTMIWDNGNSRRFSNDDQYYVLNKDEAIRELLMQRKFQCMVCQKLYCSFIFDSIRFPEGQLYEDVAVGLPTFLQSNKVVVSGESKYFYYQRKEGIVNSGFNDKKLFFLECCRDIIDYSDRNNHLYDQEAHAFYLRTLMVFQLYLYRAEKTEHNKKILKGLQKELYLQKHYIWGNKGLELRKKVVLTLMILHFPYWLLLKMWEKRAGA